jgi:TetR/AcrR family transcriptional regulator, transcriptional repressor for nem operon
MKAESETKQRLLHTAVEMLWESSFGSVSVDDICKRAGVKKGSFYYFFPSKIELTIAAMEEHWNEKRHHFDRIFSPQSPVLQRLDDACDFIYCSQKQKKEQFGKVCGCPYISIGSEMGIQDERVRLKTEELLSRGRIYWESLVRDAQTEGLSTLPYSAQVLASEIYSYIVGRILHARLSNDLQPIMSIKSGIERLLGFKQALAA